LSCASTPSATSCARIVGETLGLTLALFTHGDRAATVAARLRSRCCQNAATVLVDSANERTILELHCLFEYGSCGQ
jgi:hypothetical protein